MRLLTPLRYQAARGDETFQVVEATIDTVQAALRSRRFTCRDLVSRYIACIDAYDKAGPALNAIQIINPHAPSEAAQLDAAFAASGPSARCTASRSSSRIKSRPPGFRRPTARLSSRTFVPARDATIV